MIGSPRTTETETTDYWTTDILLLRQRIEARRVFDTVRLGQQFECVPTSVMLPPSTTTMGLRAGQLTGDARSPWWCGYAPGSRLPVAQSALIRHRVRK